VSGNVSPGPVGTTLAGILVRLFVLFIVLLFVAAWLHSLSPVLP
jgi:hypothetical protein